MVEEVVPPSQSGGRWGRGEGWASRAVFKPSFPRSRKKNPNKTRYFSKNTELSSFRTASMRQVMCWFANSDNCKRFLSTKTTCSIKPVGKNSVKGIKPEFQEIRIERNGLRGPERANP